MAVEILDPLDEGVGVLDLIHYMLAHDKIVSCVQQFIRYSEAEPKLLVCQNDVIGLIDGKDAINCRLSLSLQQRSFEQQRFLSLLALSDVINASNPARSTGEATAEISSDPLGADIEIDGNFVGSTPSSVGIVAGEHTLRVSKSGYRKWERTLKSSTGNIKIAARLEPIPIDASATSHPPTEVAAIRDPDPPANSSEGVAVEARIGIWLTGNPTARHDGIEISGVQPEGPAASIGIQPGDLILAIDGHYLYSIDDLRSDLLRRERGARLAIRYRHGRLTYDNYLILASNNGPFR